MSDETPPPDLQLRPAELPADRNPAVVYVARLGAGSRRAQSAALATMAGILSGGRLTAPEFPWHRLTYAHAAALRSALAARYAPATANRMLAALRGVLRESWRLGLTTAEAYQRTADLECIRGSRIPAGRGISAGEIKALFRTCADGTAAGARNAALLSLCYGLGLRRAEAVAVDLADVNLAGGTLRVRGKGNKERELPLVNGTLDALAAWIEVRGGEPGPLLCPINKGDRIEVRRLSDEALARVLQRLAAAAGAAPFTAHDCRRSFVSDLLDAGADVVTVAAMAGHASPQTTGRYDRRGAEVRRRAAAGLHVPFVRAAAPASR